MSKSLQSCVKEFNTHFQNFQRQKCEREENLINRRLSLLCSAQNLDIFNPDSMESCQFYINLFSLINSYYKEINSDTLWMAISVLQQAEKNLEARNAIVKQFRFIPLLTKILTQLVALDKTNRLLTLLQDLTYGIQITWEEPYLCDLIDILVNFIYGEDESHAFLSLSILINLCYKNPTCIYVLLRTVKITTFLQKINSASFGILANKIFLILDNNPDLQNVSDLKSFIKASFLEIENCTRTWDVPHLKHIVEFITNANDHEGLQIALKGYQNFCGDIENLIEALKARLGTDESSLGDQDHNNNKKICLGLIFSILDYILEFTKEEELLSPVTFKIFDFVFNWVNVEYAGVKALNVIRTIVKSSNEEELTQINRQIPEILFNLIEKSENEETTSDQTTALLKLLITLLKYPQTKGLVISNLTDTYFDKIFFPLLNINQEELSYIKFTDNDLSKYLLCLQILMEFSNIAKSVWFKRFLVISLTEQMHFVIAKGLLSQNQEICGIVFEISRSNEFPREEVSKIVAQLTPLMSTKQCSTSSLGCSGLKNFQKPIETQMFISKTLEERLDKLITHIFEASSNNQFDNFATCELIEMFNYKINLFNNSEKNLMKRLEDASVEITNLSHRLGLQVNELNKFYSMNFKLNLVQERLQSQNSDLTKQLEKLKIAANELSKKAEMEKEKYERQSRSLKIKMAKLEELSNELERYKKQEASNLAELKSLKSINKENAARIEQFKTNIFKYEESLKGKQNSLEVKEKEIIKANKDIYDLKDSNVKAENLIKNLEAQLAEKNEQIRNYETELNETEEMRRTILTLMESKRSKRKT